MINSYLSKLSLYYQMSLVGIAVQSKSCLLIHLELCLTGHHEFFRGTLTTGWAEKMAADWENLYGILVSWKMAKNVVFQFCNPIQKPCKHPVQETTANHGITPSIELKYVLYTSSFRERNTATISSIAFFFATQNRQRFVHRIFIRAKGHFCRLLSGLPRATHGVLNEYNCSCSFYHILIFDCLSVS